MFGCHEDAKGCEVRSGKWKGQWQLFFAKEEQIRLLVFGKRYTQQGVTNKFICAF